MLIVIIIIINSSATYSIITIVTFKAETSLFLLDCVLGLAVTACGDWPASAFDSLTSNLFAADTDTNISGTCTSSCTNNNTQEYLHHSTLSQNNTSDEHEASEVTKIDIVAMCC